MWGSFTLKFVSICSWTAWILWINIISIDTCNLNFLYKIMSCTDIKILCFGWALITLWTCMLLASNISTKGNTLINIKANFLRLIHNRRDNRKWIEHNIFILLVFWTKANNFLYKRDSCLKKILKNQICFLQVPWLNWKTVIIPTLNDCWFLIITSLFVIADII